MCVCVCRIPHDHQLRRIYTSSVAWSGLKRQLSTMLQGERTSQPLAFVPASLKAF